MTLYSFNDFINEALSFKGMDKRNFSWLKPEDFPDLNSVKKLLTWVRGDTDGVRSLFFGDFSPSSAQGTSRHRGDFVFYGDNDGFLKHGKMSYTGSGKPDSAIAKVNTTLLNPIGWEMLDEGGRGVIIKKKDEK